MKEWSAPIVMTVNKASLATLALTLFFSLSPTPAKAVDIVPSLYKVEDIVVNLARFGNKTASNNCTVYKRDVSDKMLSTLVKDGMPARASMGTNVKDKTKVSVELIPEVVTLAPREKLCLSWVSFSVQSRNAINLPPAKYHRDMKLIYWKGGLLVSTSQHSHKRGVREAIDKLVGQFVQQYNADQPPNFEKK